MREDELFADPGAVVETSTVVEQTRHPEPERRFAVSGEALGVVEAAGSRAWVEEGDDSGNTLDSYVLGKFHLDARLPRESKYLGSVEVRNGSRDDSTEVSFRESFLDFTYERAAYLRFGKQVLQWGRCYLWNPTDLVNVERKAFIRKVASPEGTFGLRVHVPFEARYNLYGFVDLHGAERPDEPALAGKFEFVVGGTEIALSAWGRKGRPTLYAGDFSTRLWGLDVAGEAAASRGDLFESMREEGGVLSVVRETGDWRPRASLNVGRSFDFREVKDRVSVHLELYYNGSGYGGDLFGDEREYAFAQPVELPGAAGAGVVRESGTKREFLLAHGLYRVNDHSRRYAALFTTYERFLVSDLGLTLNLIRNLDDGSSIATAGLAYRNLNDFSAGLNLYFFLGEESAEYTFGGQAVALQLTAGLSF